MFQISIERVLLQNRQNHNTHHYIKARVQHHMNQANQSTTIRNLCLQRTGNCSKEEGRQLWLLQRHTWKALTTDCFHQKFFSVRKTGKLCLSPSCKSVYNSISRDSLSRETVLGYKKMHDRCSIFRELYQVWWIQLNQKSSGTVDGILEPLITHCWHDKNKSYQRI